MKPYFVIHEFLSQNEERLKNESFLFDLIRSLAKFYIDLLRRKPKVSTNPAQ